jgi:uncharacterized protein YggE
MEQLERIMRASLAIVATLLLTGAAQAQSAQSPAVEPVIGVGMICNTPDQAKQFVELQSKGTKPEQAVDAVNARAKDARACGFAAVAFVPDQTVDTKPVRNKLLKVMRIQVVAGFDGSDWRPASMTQYAVIEDTSGESI